MNTINPFPARTTQSWLTSLAYNCELNDFSSSWHQNGSMAATTTVSYQIFDFWKSKMCEKKINLGTVILKETPFLHEWLTHGRRTTGTISASGVEKADDLTVAKEKQQQMNAEKIVFRKFAIFYVKFWILARRTAGHVTKNRRPKMKKANIFQR